MSSDIKQLRISGAIVDFRGDGVWPEIAREIKEKLIIPFFDIKFAEFDTSLLNREATGDAVLTMAVEALKTYKTGVKGPTITPDLEEVKKYNLSKKWGSPNGAIRKAISGAAIFRSPIDVSGLDKNAHKMANITIARQAVGGIYGAPEFSFPGKGTMVVSFTDTQTGETVTLKEVPVDQGVGMITTETDSSIRDYAHSTFKKALTLQKSVVLGTKKTINPIYDGRFVDIFKEIFELDYKNEFSKLDLTFTDVLIDAIAEKIVSGKLNNKLVALKNYDGDVLSDEAAGAHISLGMMDSTLENADGSILLADPPHGTAPDLEVAWHKDKKLLANPSAYIFAYAEALRHRAENAGEYNAAHRASLLKTAVVKTIESGCVTGDLRKGTQCSVSAQEFMLHVQKFYREEIKQAETNIGVVAAK